MVPLLATLLADDRIFLTITLGLAAAVTAALLWAGKRPRDGQA
jgi:hypothetical protein